MALLPETLTIPIAPPLAVDIAQIVVLIVGYKKRHREAKSVSRNNRPPFGPGQSTVLQSCRLAPGNSVSKPPVSVVIVCPQAYALEHRVICSPKFESLFPLRGMQPFVPPLSVPKPE